MARKHWIAATLMAAIAAGTAWTLATRSAPGGRPVAAPATGSPVEDAVSPAPTDIGDASVLPPPRPTPAPPPSVPAKSPPAAATGDVSTAAVPLLRDEIEDLDRRARAGDAAAACRLGAELLACERARTLQPYASNLEGQARMLAQRNARPEEVERQIDAALQRQAENEAALARCEGVDETRWPPVARYFGLAAQAGHRPSMLQFLNADRYRSDQLFRDPGLIALFRANAPRYFTALVEAGDAQLLHRWSMGAAMPHDILFDVLPPPWNDRALATAMLQQSLQARGIPPPDVPRPHPATPEQQARAEELYARHFSQHGASMAEPRPQGSSIYDPQTYRCDEAPAPLAP